MCVRVCVCVCVCVYVCVRVCICITLAAAGEPISDPGAFTIIIIFSPYRWLSCKLYISLCITFTHARASVRILHTLKLTYEC